MQVQKRRYRVLIADAGGKIGDFIADLLPPSSYSPVHRAGSAGEVRRILLETSVDIVIINAPLPDEFGAELAMDLTEGPVGVLLMVKNEVYDQVCFKVEDSGVLTVSKPVTRQSFESSLRLVTALSARLAKMEKQNQALQDKMRDIRVVNRAKWLLIEKEKMTEEDAHYYIEKKAMNSRITRREAAESVIRALETGGSGT